MRLISDCFPLIFFPCSSARSSAVPSPREVTRVPPSCARLECRSRRTVFSIDSTCIFSPADAAVGESVVCEHRDFKVLGREAQTLTENKPHDFSIKTKRRIQSILNSWLATRTEMAVNRFFALGHRTSNDQSDFTTIQINFSTFVALPASLFTNGNHTTRCSQARFV
jgi:hypothetical protein